MQDLGCRVWGLEIRMWVQGSGDQDETREKAELKLKLQVCPKS